MTTTSKTKSHYERVLSVYIVSNQDQIKISLSVKDVVAMNFTCPIIKNLHL